MCPSPLVLAQQLTHIELERLGMIGPEEFLDAFCKEPTKDVSASVNYPGFSEIFVVLHV